MMNANSGTIATMTVIGGTCNVPPATSAATTTAVTPATTDHNKEESAINNNVNKKRSISDATSTAAAAAAAAIGTAVDKEQETIVPSSIKYHLVNHHHHPSSQTSKNLKRKGEDPLSCLSPVLKKNPRILENNKNKKKKEQQCNVRWNDRANIIYTQEDPLKLYPNEYKDTDVWYTVSHYIRRIACYCYCFWY
jgi:hypothetical protein